MGDSERRDTPFRVPINRETCRGHPDGHRDEGGLPVRSLLCRERIQFARAHPIAATQRLSTNTVAAGHSGGSPKIGSRYDRIPSPGV